MAPDSIQPADERNPARPASLMDFRKILAIALLLVLLVFVFMNLDRANIWFFGIRAEMPIALLVIACAGLGFGAGQLLAFINQKKAPKPPEKKA